MERMYGIISAAHKRGFATEPPTPDHAFCLLETLHAHQQAHAPASIMHLRLSDYTTLVTGYQLIWQALERAGLHLEHQPSTVIGAAPVWFFHWHGGPRHGPFATLDATLAAALAHVHANGAKEGAQCTCAGTHAYATG